jgi:hypothetical protein
MAEIRLDVSEIVNRAVDKLIESGWRPSEWIPCSERMPEDDENVLVYILTSHMNFISLAHIHKGVFRTAWNHDKITNVEITHWMPLPEPPEKE